MGIYIVGRLVVYTMGWAIVWDFMGWGIIAGILGIVYHSYLIVGV